MTTSTSALAVLLFLGLLASATPAVEESRHQQELREHYHHLHYIAEYSCHHPQPRTVPVQELLSPYQTRGKAYFPEYTVLHRCDVFAGCCEGAKKCGPLHADNINLPFKVTYLEDMGDKHKGEWEMEYAHFDNHTICGCVDHNGVYKPEHPRYPEDHKDHHKHEDHDHKHEDHDHKHEDHYAEESHQHKYSQTTYKEQYPPLGKDPVRKESYRPSEETYTRPEKRPERPDRPDRPDRPERPDRPDQKYDNKKIDSLYISI